MKIVNVKTSVIELLFHHRESENSEKNREGSLCFTVVNTKTSLPVFLTALCASVVKR